MSELADDAWNEGNADDMRDFTVAADHIEVAPVEYERVAEPEASSQMTDEQKAAEYDMLEFDRNHILDLYKEEGSTNAAQQRRIVELEEVVAARFEKLKLRELPTYALESMNRLAIKELAKRAALATPSSEEEDKGK